MRHFQEAPLFGLQTSAPVSTAKPHWQGHRDRLRTKLIERGPNALEDYELLETLLFAFIPRRDVKPVAKALLARFGSLSGVLAARPAAGTVCRGRQGETRRPRRGQSKSEKETEAPPAGLVAGG